MANIEQEIHEYTPEELSAVCDEQNRSIGLESDFFQVKYVGFTQTGHMFNTYSTFGTPEGSSTQRSLSAKADRAYNINKSGGTPELLTDAELEELLSLESKTFKVHFTIPTDFKLEILREVLQRCAQGQALNRNNKLYPAEKSAAFESTYIKATQVKMYPDGTQLQMSSPSFVLYFFNQEEAEHAQSVLLEILTNFNIPDFKAPRSRYQSGEENRFNLGITQGSGDTKNYVLNCHTSTDGKRGDDLMSKYFDPQTNYALYRKE